MRAYYDLKCSPPTYDFISFLVGAEIERLRQGKEGIDLHILPGPANGFRNDKLPPFTTEEREKMRDAIVVPGANLLPSIRSVTLHPDRNSAEAAGYGIGQGLYGLKYIMAGARENLFPLRAPLMADVPENRRLITITLRESSYWPRRNSDLDHWKETARQLEALGHPVRFIRDTAFADEPIPGFYAVPGPAKSIVQRSVWYASAKLNLFVNNGPAWLCFFMDAPMLVTKLIVPSAPCSNKEFFRQCGLPFGSQMPNSGTHRRILWDDDRPEVVVPAVLEMLA